jgi:Nucleotidyltransferase of unknown function (DUF6036)
MAELPVNNPERILRILDSYLEKETRIVLFGRAALALGYGISGSQFGKTMDVDAILPTVEMGKIEADAQFWKAIELTNKHLLPEGLYVSHLFTDEQVALTPNWLDKIVPIAVTDLRHLRLFRPSSTDLILTKMMRNDRQDIEDIAFVLSREKIDAEDLDKAFASVKPLELIELRRIFSEMQPKVRDMAVRSIAAADLKRKLP